MCPGPKQWFCGPEWRNCSALPAWSSPGPPDCGAGIGLALYALCVWPANIHHFALDMAKEGGGLGLGYHVPRMIAQPVLIWLALWVGGATNWPLRRAA